MAHHDIVFVNKEEEVVTVVAETEEEKEDIVAILERNNALFTVDTNSNDKGIGIPA